MKAMLAPAEKHMTQMMTTAPDPVSEVLGELASFRDRQVKAMFEVYVDRGWLRNLFAVNERWLEVQWIDNGHVQLNVLSRQPSSAVPVNWEPQDESQWLVPAGRFFDNRSRGQRITLQSAS